MFYKLEARNVFLKDFFGKTLLFSILAHFALLLLVEWKTDNSALREDIIEVNLVRIRRQKAVPRAVSSELKPLPGKESEVAAKKKPLSMSGDKINAVPPKPLLSIKSNLDSNNFNLGKAPAIFDKKGMEAPGVRDPGDQKITPEKENLDFFTEEPSKEGKLISFGELEEDIDLNRAGAGDLKRDVRVKIGSKEKPAEPDKVTPRKLNFSPKNYIEGEVRNRKILYKPKPPRLNIDRDAVISLKFTVLPNGEVDRISPYLKADPRLERAAVSLLRLYRFEPLFRSDNIQEGIIHFTISRAD